MAVTELIHFPLPVQLSLRHALPADILFEPRCLVRVGPPVPHSCAFSGCECLSRPQATSRLTAGLKRLQSVPFFQRDLIQYARSDLEVARVYANRELFDNFEKIVEDDARWAHRFQSKFSERVKDRDDIYLEVKSSEERRKRKGLPSRLVILPDWGMSDEDRYDEERARRRSTKGAKKRRTQPQSKEARQ